VPLPKLGAVDPTAKVSRIKQADLIRRPQVLVDLGPHMKNHAMPHPDPQDPHTMLAGVAKRFAVRPPDIDPDVLERFRAFVAAWIPANLTRLSPDVDTSVDHWLESTSYPLKRKIELAEKWKKLGSIKALYSNKKYFRCKSFMKDE